MGTSAQKLYGFEWVGCILWILVWGSLAYLALSERSITVGGGKSGLGGAHFEAGAAVAVGCAMLGMAILGVSWLFRVSRYRRLLWSILFGSFVAATAILYGVLVAP